MYAYIKGELTIKNPTYVVLENNGIGYRVHITLQTFTKIEHQESARLWIYQHVKEDSLALYGFYTEDERDMFVLLISVSGIGPNTGRLILSSMTTGEVMASLANEDVPAFKRIKGVGPKTAQRIIIDLKDKAAKIKGSVLISSSTGNTAINEALSALMALGFKRPQINKVLEDVRKSNREVTKTEDFIRLALKKLS